MTMGSGRILRIVAACLLLAGGAIHLRLHLDDYATTTIGRTFVANAAASALAAGYLVLRRDRVGPLAGIALSLGSLAGLVLTRTGDGFLGFRETGLNPAPDVLLTVASEVLAAILLTALLVMEGRRSTPGPSHPSSRRPDRPLVARPIITGWDQP